MHKTLQLELQFQYNILNVVKHSTELHVYRILQTTFLKVKRSSFKNRFNLASEKKNSFDLEFYGLNHRNPHYNHSYVIY